MEQPKLPKLNEEIENYKKQFQLKISENNLNSYNPNNEKDNFISLGLDYNPELSVDIAEYKTQMAKTKEQVARLETISELKKTTIKNMHNNVKINRNYIDKKYDKDEQFLYEYSITVGGVNVFKVIRPVDKPLDEIGVLEAYRDRTMLLEYDYDVKKYKESLGKLGHINIYDDSDTNGKDNVKEYKKLAYKQNEVNSLLDDLKYKRILGATYREVLDEIKAKQKEMSTATQTIQHKLECASTDIYTLATLNMFKRHYKSLATTNNSLLTFRRMLNTDNHIINKHTNDIFNNFDTGMTAYNLANNLFEQNKKSAYDKESNTYKSKWVNIEDKKYVENLGETLPSYVKVDTNGQYLIDINNARFEDLSIDWQIGNFALAQLVMGIARTDCTSDDICKVVANNPWLKIAEDKIVGCNINLPVKELENKNLLIDMINDAGTQAIHQKLK